MTVAPRAQASLHSPAAHLLRSISDRIMSASAAGLHTAAGRPHAHTPRSTVLTLNGRPLPSAMTANDLLKFGPRGAYTSGRTVRKTSVFGLDHHLQRLATSSATIGANIGVGEDILAECELERLAPRVKECLRASLEEWIRLCPEAEHEAKLTVLLGLAASSARDVAPPEEILHDGHLQVFVQVSPLVSDGCRGTHALIQGAPRSHAKAKDSSWVHQRAALEEVKTGSVDEVLLMADTGAVVEGTQTNFFALQGGKVYTADAGVLHGTVRAVVLDVCKANGIPVVLKPPNLGSAHAWEGAFVSSTSRLAHQLTHIHIPKVTLDRFEAYCAKQRSDSSSRGNAAVGTGTTAADTTGGTSGAAESETGAQMTIELPPSATIDRIVAGVEAGILARSTELLAAETRSTVVASDAASDAAAAVSDGVDPVPDSVGEDPPGVSSSSTTRSAASGIGSADAV